MKLNYELFSLR